MDIPETRVTFDTRNRTKTNKNTKQLRDEQQFYHRVCKYSNTTGATSGSGTAVLTEFLISPPFLVGIFGFMCGVL
jgi:hypothetical protein